MWCSHLKQQEVRPPRIAVHQLWFEYTKYNDESQHGDLWVSETQQSHLVFTAKGCSNVKIGEYSLSTRSVLKALVPDTHQSHLGFSVAAMSRLVSAHPVLTQYSEPI